MSNRSLSYVFLSGFDNNSIGHDEPDCLFQPEKVHCSTLNYVLTSIMTKQMFWICTIYINDFTSTEDQTLNLPEMAPSTYPRPRKVNIICLNSCVYNKKLRIYAEMFQRHFLLQLEGFMYDNSRIFLQNIHIVFKNVRFVESLITDWERSEKGFGQIEVHFEQTTFVGHSQKKTYSGIRMNKVFIASIFVQSSKFSFVSTILSIHNSFFDSQNTSYVDSEIHLNNKILSVVKFANIYLTGESSHHRDEPMLKIVGIKMQVDFIHCVFKNTTGLEISKKDTMLLDSWIEVTVTSCLFHKNRKFESGGAISVQYSAPLVKARRATNFLKITNSTLIQNEAVRIGSVLSQGRALSVKSQANTDTCAIIYVEIENNSFINNIASDGGGALFASAKCIKVTVKDSIFEVTDMVFDSPKGVFISSHSDISIESSVFSRDLDLNHQSPSLIQLDMLSEETSIRHLSIILQCHAWYKPTTETNFIQMQAKAVEIFCTSCQPSFYVPTDGYFHATMQPDQGTIVIREVKTNSKELNCLPCPAGAKCPGNNFITNPNFWGLKSQENISMYQCPAQYCCSKDCVGYNQCAGDRTGILCGSCKKNYSLSMLSSRCVSADVCNDSWMWPFMILAAMLCMSWYTFKDDVFGIPTKVCVKICKSKSTNSQDSDVKYLKCYFGIVTYFMQIKAVMMLEISVDSGRIIDRIFIEIDSCIQLVLKFELADLSKDTCPLEGMTTSHKMMFRFFFLVGVYLFWNLFFLSVCLSEYISAQFHLNCDKYEKIRSKLVSGLIEIIKYTYSGFSSIVFYSLTCTTVDTGQVWFYDGTVECYSKWQIIVFIFCLLCLIPYPLFVFVGMKLLKRRTISRRSFFLGVCLPLPALIFWCFLSVKQQMNKEDPDQNQMKGQKIETDVEEAIYNGFRGGYRESDGGTQYWEGVMILRRLMLGATILIPNASMQLCVCLALCLLFLFHHAFVKPFKNPIANYVEGFSLTLLCGLAAINLLKASYLHTDVNPQGSQVGILQNLELIESMSVFLLVMFAITLETSSALRNRAKQTVVQPGLDPTLQSSVSPVGLAAHTSLSSDENQGPDNRSNIELETITQENLCSPLSNKQ